MARQDDHDDADRADRLVGALAWLAHRGSARNRKGMARFGITTAKAFGVSMATMRPLVRRLGRDQALAEALWRSGWLEARVVAGLIADPARLTRTSMNAWARDFDNWAITDSTCLHLFCHTPYAWDRVRTWSRRRGEFQRRAAFALLAALTVHDREAPDAAFTAFGSALLDAAHDDRVYVRKGVNWALRQIGKRNRALHAWAVSTARAIAAIDTPTARWIASDALRELRSPAVRARVNARRRPRRAGRA